MDGTRELTRGSFYYQDRCCTFLIRHIYLSMGQNQVSFIERCPISGASFFGGFTVSFFSFKKVVIWSNDVGSILWR
jgi:hypothetical protein